MPKDSLSEALFELGDRKRGKPAKKRRPPKAKRGRPKAFDSFYVFSVFLLALGLGLQLIAILLYS